MPVSSKGCPGQRHIDQAGTQAGGRIGEVGLPHTDVNAGVRSPVRRRQPAADLGDAVGERADRDGVRAGRGGDADPRLVCLREQGAGLVVEGDAGRGQRHAGG
jgi:hypothetical protein